MDLEALEDELLNIAIVIIVKIIAKIL